jgi:uncharacterized membrane protein YgdD (TMEM256/DUF423 family)
LHFYSFTKSGAFLTEKEKPRSAHLEPMHSPKLVTCSSLAFIGVAAGAFGAHALKAHLIEAGMTSAWDKAVLYQLVHSVAGMAVSLAPEASRSRWLERAVTAWVLGIIFFSGSLYSLALGGPAVRWAGPITPLGGLSFLAGWLFMVVAAAKNPGARQT